MNAFTLSMLYAYLNKYHIDLCELAIFINTIVHVVMKRLNYYAHT
jgi:hypothetical protein